MASPRFFAITLNANAQKAFKQLTGATEVQTVELIKQLQRQLKSSPWLEGANRALKYSPTPGQTTSAYDIGGRLTAPQRKGIEDFVQQIQERYATDFATDKEGNIDAAKMADVQKAIADMIKTGFTSTPKGYKVFDYGALLSAGSYADKEFEKKLRSMTGKDPSVYRDTDKRQILYPTKYPTGKKLDNGRRAPMSRVLEDMVTDSWELEETAEQVAKIERTEAAQAKAEKLKNRAAAQEARKKIAYTKRKEAADRNKREADKKRKEKKEAARKEERESVAGQLLLPADYVLELPDDRFAAFKAVAKERNQLEAEWDIDPHLRRRNRAMAIDAKVKSNQLEREAVEQNARLKGQSVEDYLAKNFTGQSGSSSLLRNMDRKTQVAVKQRAELERLSLYDDEKYITRRRTLELSAAAKREKAEMDYYMHGEGKGTERGLEYVQRRRDRMERFNMRGTGRFGKWLRKLGVGSKTAGRIGRVTNAIGTKVGAVVAPFLVAKMIIDAVVGIVKLVINVLGKISETATKIANLVTMSMLGQTATGMSYDDIKFSERATALFKKRGYDVDLMEFRGNVATKLGNVAADKGEGIRMAATGLAEMTAAAGIGGGVDGAVNLMLNKENDASYVADWAMMTALKGMRNNKSLYGGSTNAREWSAYLNMIGNGGGKELQMLVTELTALSKTNPQRAANAYKIIDEWNGKNPQDMYKRLITEIVPDSAVLERHDTESRGAAKKSVGDAFSNAVAVFSATIEALKGLLLTAFGPNLLNIMEQFQDALLGFAMGVNKWFKLGIDFQPLIDDRNRNRYNKSLAQDKEYAAAIDEYQQGAIAIYESRGLIDPRSKPEDKLAAARGYSELFAGGYGKLPTRYDGRDRVPFDFNFKGSAEDFTLLAGAANMMDLASTIEDKRAQGAKAREKYPTTKIGTFYIDPTNNYSVALLAQQSTDEINKAVTNIQRYQNMMQHERIDETVRLDGIPGITNTSAEMTALWRYAPKKDALVYASTLPINHIGTFLKWADSVRENPKDSSFIKGLIKHSYKEVYDGERSLRYPEMTIGPWGSADSKRKPISSDPVLQGQLNMIVRNSATDISNVLGQQLLQGIQSLQVAPLDLNYHGKFENLQIKLTHNLPAWLATDAPPTLPGSFILNESKNISNTPEEVKGP